MGRLPLETDAHLSNFLRQHQVITQQQYNNAVKYSKEHSTPGVIPSLILMEVVTEEDIRHAIIQKTGLQAIDFQSENLIDRPLSQEFNDQFVLRNRIIPIKLTNNTLMVVVTDTKAIEECKNITTHPLQIVVATLSSVEQYLLILVRKGNQPAATGQKPAQQAPGEKIDPAVLASQKKEPAFKASSSWHSNVIEFVNVMIESAIGLGVSDIHIERFRKKARLRYRNDGVLKEIEEFSSFLEENYPSIIARVKILSSLDISERRLPQDGRISFPYEDDNIDLRVSILPTSFGERVVMRIMSKQSLNTTLDLLGFSKEDLVKLRKAIYAPQGMALVTGPTGSGKSTTLYAMLNELNKTSLNILTAEDPVEYNIEGIGQVPLKENIGLSFSAILRSFLRQDPEIIMVGEIRDKETADISIKAALTGHLVLSTLHTNDAPSTITRLLNMEVPSYLLTSSLSLVIAQRLARLNCPNCKEPDTGQSKDNLLNLGFNEQEIGGLQLKVSKGCDACLGTGIKGRL